MPGDLLSGTLELLVLKTVSLCLQHGCGTLLRIQQGGALKIEQGALYRAFYKRGTYGELPAQWRIIKDNRRTRLYAIAAQGHKRLRDKTDGWKAVAAALSAGCDSESRGAVA